MRLQNEQSDQIKSIKPETNRTLTHKSVITIPPDNEKSCLILPKNEIKCCGERKYGTFNIAAEIARLVKRSTFATAKDRIFIVPFLGSRNGVNSAYS